MDIDEIEGLVREKDGSIRIIVADDVSDAIAANVAVTEQRLHDALALLDACPPCKILDAPDVSRSVFRKRRSRRHPSDR